MHWESALDLSPLFPDGPSFFTALRQALSASVISEKKRAFGVEVLLYVRRTEGRLTSSLAYSSSNTGSHMRAAGAGSGSGASRRTWASGYARS